MLTASRSAPSPPASVAALTSATVNYTRRDRHTSLAEPSDAPGLLIVPDIAEGAFTGAWVVVHRRSGLKLPVTEPCGLAHARQYATALAALHTDWTRGEDEVRTDQQLKAAMWSLLWSLDLAVAGGRPLWWARWSLQQQAPMWTATHTGGDAWHGDFARLTQFLDQYSGLGDFTVTYDPAPTWRLRCAAPGCTAAVAFYDEDSESSGDARTTCRRELIRLAHEQRWHRHDPGRWTCPACTLAHQPISPADLDW